MASFTALRNLPAGSLLREITRSFGTKAHQTIEIGQVWSRQRTFLQEDVNAFVRVTGDANPIHENDGPILPGMLCASMFPGIIGSELQGAIYVSQTLHFRNMAQVGSTLIGEVKLAKNKRNTFLEFDTVCRLLESNVVVCEGVAVAKIDKANVTLRDRSPARRLA